MGYLFDLATLVLMTGCFLIGMKRGFIREFFDLVATAAGAVIAGICQRMGIQFFHSIDGSERLGKLVSILVQFALAAVVVRLIGRILRKRVQAAPVANVDNVLGSLLALAKAVVILGFILVMLVRYPLLGTGWIQQSILAPMLLFAGKMAIFFFPADFLKSVRDLLPTL